MKSKAVFFALILGFLANSAFADEKVVVLELKGALGVATAEYIVNGIEHAEAIDAELVIIDMDTPGGLMGPMRDIIQAILNSSVPVATYVSPEGARADSAGTYILYASHIAAMAPTTHLGAATPVSLTGDSVTPEPGNDDSGQDEDAEEGGDSESSEPAAQPQAGTSMERKVLNDAIAYIRGLADRHGRNADWAEEAVRDASTLTASEALENNVIEFIAEDHAALLEMINGHEVEVHGETVALETGSVILEEYESSLRLKILSAVANPEIVIILGMIGIYGLMYEGYNPGAIIPGVVGIICLLLAAYGLQVLPVNYAGLALIIVGLALMTAEAFAPSFGALGLGGITAFVFGAIMMFDSGVPGFGISLGFVIGVAIVAAALIILLMTFLLKLRRRGSVSGRDSIIGGIGRAMQDFAGDGKVWLEGEAWSAHSDVPVSKDDEVEVMDLEGLTLKVRPAEQKH